MIEGLDESDRCHELSILAILDVCFNLQRQFYRVADDNDASDTHQCYLHIINQTAETEKPCLKSNKKAEAHTFNIY
jgi:hypothetical protein